MDAFSRHAIRVSVAQICQLVGWTSIHTSPLEILTDILQEYITGIARLAARYAMLFGQSEPNLHHVALAFKEMGISISELEEYVTYVESGSVLDVPKYPIPKESHLNHLKPGSREVLTRPVHIHEHLPPMHPHLEDQDYLISNSPLTVEVPTSDSLSPLSSPKGIFKKPGDPISSDPRRGRSLLEDETRPVREISSVMMTTSGFLSPAREGKLPEARTQPVEFSNPSSPETIEPQPELPQPVDVNKTEKEKNKKNKPVEVPIKKPEKEIKIKEELPVEPKDSEDELKGKKLVTTKEASKLKALKTGALKMQQKPTSPSPSPPPQKKAKLSPNGNQPINPKQSKVRSPNKNDKRSLSPLGKDMATLFTKESTTEVDIKLPSEPDKQKLNIFKKITKVKDDHEELKSTVFDQRDSNLSPVDTFIPQCKNAGDTSIKDTFEVLDLKMDVEVTSHDTPTNNDSIIGSGIPNFDKPLEIIKVSEPKKKKKDKQKDKKELSEKEKDSPKIKLPEENIGKPGIDVVMSEVEQLSSFSTASSSVLPTSGLISTWSNNPSSFTLPIPPINIPTSDSNSVSSKNQETPVNTEQMISVSSPSNSASHTLIASFPSKENELLVIKKKEKKRDKKLKDKTKKKKDKKDKNKIKHKSERKKLKMEKKEKAKLKLKKEKKEKKKEKEALASRTFEQSHIAEDILNTLTPWATEGGGVLTKKIKLDDKDESPSQVPKITFKLGPASPKDVSEGPCPRKIVIKPIIKKEEETIGACTSITPEPFKAPNTSKVKAHKSGKSSHHSKSDTPEKPPTFLMPHIIPPKQDSFPIVPKWESEPAEVWICPACQRPDDGSPMIACDMCDMWFHWTCVGIVEDIESDWYCEKCMSKRVEGHTEKKKKHRKKKN